LKVRSFLLKILYHSEGLLSIQNFNLKGVFLMELIDKDLNIWAKSIAELSFKEVDIVLNSFGDGTIGELAFMYEENINLLTPPRIVIFREHINFDVYSYFIPIYMKSDKEKKQKIKKYFIEKGIPKDNFDLLDNIIAKHQYRTDEKMAFIQKIS